MATGSVTSERRARSWKLAPPVASLTQGLVVTGFGSLPTGRALFVRLGQPDQLWDGAGRWLADLRALAPVTSATPPDKQDGHAQTHAVSVAFTWTGLQRMGLSDQALASFSRPFQEGMMQADRLRRLGDRRGSEWLGTVVDDGPVWSGNTPSVEREHRPPTAYEVTREAPPDVIRTPITVHAVVLLYALDEPSASDLATAVETMLRGHDIEVVVRRELVLDVQKGDRVSREFFGFADGLSQPLPFDQDRNVIVDGNPVVEPHEVQGVPLGEFLIGHVNGHREKAPGPVVPGDPDGHVDRPKSAGLVASENAEGFFDLGVNGTYMVIRELEQYVSAFWQTLDEDAAKIRAQDPQRYAHVTATWLAERIVGRNTDGHLLCPGGLLKADADEMPDNNYLFHATDPHGIGCPLGSHVRRSNPRDSLAPSESERSTLLAATNNHRILRRGRKFGPPVTDPRKDDGHKRGLLFMCLNTDIARQFEFIQQVWLLNRNFGTLFGEVDPLVGPDGLMTIREESLRQRIEVKTFVKLAGGEYFFLPSLPALKYLELL
jgi:deferrochelatase/peroxidase EfeB